MACGAEMKKEAAHIEISEEEARNTRLCELFVDREAKEKKE